MNDWRALPYAPAAGTRLCAAGDVSEGQGREVVFGEGKDAFRIVLFRIGPRVLAYHNCCPHFSLPLNYEPDLFHLLDGGVLMCAHHTAMFRIEDGALRPPLIGLPGLGETAADSIVERARQ